MIGGLLSILPGAVIILQWPVSHERRAEMSDIEKIELARYHKEIVADIHHMLGKYQRIMEWDIPDVEEQEVRALVARTIKEALAEVLGEG